MFSKKNKTLDDKITEIDITLSELKLPKNKPRGLIALQIERQALPIPQSSETTREYINNILEPTLEDDKVKKTRGRPKKNILHDVPKDISANKEATSNSYNLRSTKRK